MTYHTLHPDLLTTQVNIALVGAGGNGSQMLTGLARLHTALLALGHPRGFHITVYDPDRVSESNIGRQLFSPADVGQYKSCVLVHRLNCYYGLDWEARPHKFTLPAAGYSPHMTHIVISCVDSVASRREIDRLLRARRTVTPHYWLDMGNRQQDGQVVFGHHIPDFDRKRWKEKPTLPNLFDLFPELAKGKVKEDVEAPSCSLAESLQRQELFINDAVTRMALHLLWTLFRKGKIEHHGYFINLAEGRVNPLPVPGRRSDAEGEDGDGEQQDHPGHGDAQSSGRSVGDGENRVCAPARAGGGKVRSDRDG
jgi:PRTRC genetic system ThiF family protein